MTAPQTLSPSGPGLPPGWDPTVVASEMLGAYACACDVWTGYLTRLAAARTPMDVVDAGARFTLESVEICERAAAGRLREGGLRTPLLNDA
jgi:hypothetical protein